MIIRYGLSWLDLGYAITQILKSWSELIHAVDLSLSECRFVAAMHLKHSIAGWHRPLVCVVVPSGHHLAVPEGSNTNHVTLIYTSDQTQLFPSDHLHIACDRWLHENLHFNKYL